MSKKIRQYDCMWIDAQCKSCPFYHKLVDEPIKCPRGLKPNMRVLG